MIAEKLEYDMSPKEAAHAAALAGFKVHWPTPTQLFLDLDTKKAQAYFWDTALTLLGELYPKTRVLKYWISKSGVGQHVIVTLGRSVPVKERITLQAVCGSDPKRELLALVRVAEGVDKPIVLFQPPQKLLTAAPECVSLDA